MALKAIWAEEPEGYDITPYELAREIMIGEAELEYENAEETAYDTAIRIAESMPEDWTATVGRKKIARDAYVRRLKRDLKKALAEADADAERDCTGAISLDEAMRLDLVMRDADLCGMLAEPDYISFIIGQYEGRIPLDADEAYMAQLEVELRAWVIREMVADAYADWRSNHGDADGSQADAVFVSYLKADMEATRALEAELKDIGRLEWDEVLLDAMCAGSGKGGAEAMSDVGE
jgi:hypothetical protein